MPENADTRDNSTAALILGGVMIILIAWIVMQFASVAFQNSGGQVHPPQVNISRDTYNDIVIVWEGGIDSQFVGNFSVTIDNITTRYEKPEYTGFAFATIKHPEYVCVDVDAYDLAVHSYRPIGRNCL